MPSRHSSSPTLSWFFTKPRQLFLSGQYLCSSLFGFGWMFMGSMLGDLPSYDPHNFSQLRPSDPAHPSKSSPTTYRPTHNRTSPPPNQVISTEATNILLRQFYQQTEEKLTLRPKRAASDHLTPEQGGRKQLRSCFADDTI